MYVCPTNFQVPELAHELNLIANNTHPLFNHLGAKITNENLENLDNKENQMISILNEFSIDLDKDGSFGTFFRNGHESNGTYLVMNTITQPQVTLITLIQP